MYSQIDLFRINLTPNHINGTNVDRTKSQIGKVRQCTKRHTAEGRSPVRIAKAGRKTIR